MRKETFGASEYHYYPQAVPAELLLLGGGVPDCSFSIFDPETDFSSGQQAGKPTLEYADPETKRELLICKRLGEHRGLTIDEAETQLREWREYRRTLAIAGWQTPELYSAHIEPAAGGHVIKTREAYILGEDGDHMIRNPRQSPYAKFSMTNSLIDRLYSYPQHWLKSCRLDGKTVRLLPHGIDLKPSNVAINEDTRQCVLLDTFAPKLLDENGDLACYSAKLERHSPESIKRLCATREGCLLRYWRTAERLWLEAEQERPVECRLTANDLRGTFLGYLSMQCDIRGIADESDFIQEQIEAGYPWLDSLEAA